MAVRSRLILLALLLLGLASTLEAREVLRYAPPEGPSEGAVTVTLTAGSGPYTLVQGAALSNGDVRVHLELDSTETILFARVDMTDSDETVVASYTDSVAWSPELHVELSWFDGMGGSDAAGTYFRENSGTDFRENSGTDFRENSGTDFRENSGTEYAADIAVANSGSGRAMTAFAEEGDTVQVTAYHPATGELPILVTQTVTEPADVDIDYDAYGGTLSVWMSTSEVQAAEVLLGSTVTCRIDRPDGQSVTGTFIAR